MTNAGEPDTLRERCVALVSQARGAALQRRVQDLRTRLAAARSAVPKNFAVVGALGRELNAAEEELAESATVIIPVAPAEDGTQFGTAHAVLTAEQRAAHKDALVAELQARCEQLEEAEDFAALEDLGQLLLELTGLEL